MSAAGRVLPATAHRVAEQTDPEVNHRIRRQMRRDVAWFEEHPEAIPERLRQLDREWDVERVLITNSSLLTLFALTRVLLGARRWLVVPVMVQGFLLQHALQGWCPPLTIIRRLGVRTAQEIEEERRRLLRLRGAGRRRDAEGGV